MGRAFKKDSTQEREREIDSVWKKDRHGRKEVRKHKKKLLQESKHRYVRKSTGLQERVSSCEDSKGMRHGAGAPACEKE